MEKFVTLQYQSKDAERTKQYHRLQLYLYSALSIVPVYQNLSVEHFTWIVGVLLLLQQKSSDVNVNALKLMFRSPVTKTVTSTGSTIV